MYNKSFFILSVAVATLFGSCQDYDYGFSAEEIHYKTQFTKEVGDIDPNQDFNLANRTYVNVSPGTSSNIKVYMKQGTSWSLVADYADVTSVCDIYFDVVKGTQEVCVTDGLQAFNVPLGSNVAFTGTRAGSWDVNDELCDIHLNEGSEFSYYYYDLSIKDEIDAKLPEDCRNKDITIQNFTMVSNGPFVVYPLYWYCQAIDLVGIYWKTAYGELEERTLFGNHIFNESVQMMDSTGNWNSDLRYGNWGPVSDKNYTEGPYRIAKTGFAVEDASNFRSKGIVVDLPKGTVFGFYMNPRFYGRYVPSNHKYLQKNYPDLLPHDYGEFKHYYSDANLNPLETIATPDSMYADTTMYCFATYFDNRGDLVVCCEDGIGGYSSNGTTYSQAYDNYWRTYDFNDLSFKIYGAIPEVLSNKAAEWLLPFEDLGNSFDLDFNDIILKMSYVSGTDKAYVTPLAAGGTLHSEVMFNDTEDEYLAQNLGEIHTLLGAEPLDADSLYAPINASSRGKAGKTMMVTVHNPEHFSIANALDEANGSNAYHSTKQIVGLYIKTSGSGEGTTVTYQGMGKIPAMLVLPTTYERDNKYYEWAWPTENTDIRSSYGVSGHSFAEWIADHTKSTDWYKYPNGETVEEKSYSSYVRTIIEAPEYDMSKYGGIVSLPSKVDSCYYAFDARLLDGMDKAVITIVLKGVDHNALCAYDGSMATDTLGVWSRLDIEGVFQVMGNNSCGEGGVGSSSFEGVYQVILNLDELSAIRSKGYWLVTCSPENTILYMAISR